jgi:hypothetical protein
MVELALLLLLFITPAAVEAAEARLADRQQPLLVV